MNAIIPAVTTLVTLAVSGCGTPETDADYGRSVQQMVQAQTYDPVAASNPPELAPETADAARLKNALDVYRKDVAKGNVKVEETVEFEVAK
jgi:type IV pilus biogenesis protein CpaD/CtpE